MGNKIIILFVFLLSLSLSNLCCTRKSVEDAKEIFEGEPIINTMTKANEYLIDNKNDYTNILGEYVCSTDDYGFALTLKVDHTYHLIKKGWRNDSCIGSWEIRNNFLFLRRKVLEPYYKLVNNDSDQNTYLTVYDVYTKDVLICEHSAKSFLFVKKNYSTIKTKIPNSTRLLTIMSPGYSSVFMKLNHLKNKNIEVYISPSKPSYLYDSLKIATNRLVKSTIEIFRRREDIPNPLYSVKHPNITILAPKKTEQ